MAKQPDPRPKGNALFRRFGIAEAESKEATEPQEAPIPPPAEWCERLLQRRNKKPKRDAL
jgi:hypothetical protein